MKNMYVNKKVAFSVLSFVAVMAVFFIFPINVNASNVRTPPPTTFDEAWGFRDAMDIFFTPLVHRHYYSVTATTPGPFEIILDVESTLPTRVYIYDSNRNFRTYFDISRFASHLINSADRTFMFQGSRYYVVVYNLSRLSIPYRIRVRPYMRYRTFTTPGSRVELRNTRPGQPGQPSVLGNLYVDGRRVPPLRVEHRDYSPW